VPAFTISSPVTISGNPTRLILSLTIAPSNNTGCWPMLPIYSRSQLMLRTSTPVAVDTDRARRRLNRSEGRAAVPWRERKNQKGRTPPDVRRPAHFHRRDVMFSSQAKIHSLHFHLQRISALQYCMIRSCLMPRECKLWGLISVTLISSRAIPA
jgi:hypothetical protein